MSVQSSGSLDPHQLMNEVDKLIKIGKHLEAYRILSTFYTVSAPALSSDSSSKEDVESDSEDNTSEPNTPQTSTAPNSINSGSSNNTDVPSDVPVFGETCARPVRKHSSANSADTVEGILATIPSGIRGFLNIYHKKEIMKKKWQSRWCEIDKDSRQLKMFVNERKNGIEEEEPLMVIDLNQTKKFKPIEYDVYQQHNCFQFDIFKVTYLLSANTTNDYKSWSTTIKKFSKLRKTLKLINSVVRSSSPVPSYVTMTDTGSSKKEIKKEDKRAQMPPISRRALPEFPGSND